MHGTVTTTVFEVGDEVGHGDRLGLATLGEVLESSGVAADEASVSGGLEGGTGGAGAGSPAGPLGGVPLYTPRRGPTWDTGTLQVRAL
jgi:hypothetical protein